jgi:uncharacterized membrane protein
MDRGGASALSTTEWPHRQKTQEAQMASPGTSDIELEWVRQLEDYVQEVLRSRATRDVNALQEERTTFGQHAADVLAARAGSWTFILSFLAVLGLWITVNIVVLVHHWDPYPFILLNLVLSCLAAIQAPIIMMSQQRQATRDRLQAETDYQVNVKAEILLEHLTKEVEEIKWLVGAASRTGIPPDSARRP